MIWQSIDALHKNLDLIDKHLSNALLQEKILTNALEGGDAATMSLIDNYTAEKQFRNKAVIISLYGAFEQFVEALLTDYIMHMHTYMPKFSELPKQVRMKYVEKWKKFHSKLRYPLYLNIKEKDIIANLYEVVCNDKNQIMPSCYKRSGGNYTLKVIRGTYYDIGIEIEPVKKYCKLPIGDNIIRFEAIQDKVDDLVERRNCIAHTAADEMDLLSITELQLYVDVIRIFSIALFDYVQDILLKLIWNRDKAKYLVLQAARALLRPKVLYFEDVKGAMIEKGQQVIVRMPDGNYPQFRQTKVDGISYSEHVGDKTIFADKIISTKLYHDLSIHFSTDDVIHRNVQVLFM